MALLVNYEGVYQEPQTLWYKVDGVWKEVIQVFESPVQNEIALTDAQRIEQDKVVNSILTKIENINALLDGSDPTVTQVTDPAEIAILEEELTILQLQLDITKIEQVALTKELFEQKAQIEYKRLVMEGDKAFDKISALVDSPDIWGVIRIEPVDLLDERLELVIQHGLPTDERIFNYGSIYYRLYKLNQVDPEDNLATLANEFKRRLNYNAFVNNYVATNYIMSTKTIEEVFMEMSSFVSGGAQRIKDYLDSLVDQQKYILDNVEKVKSSIEQLTVFAAESSLITVSESGFIISNSTMDAQKIELGSYLLASQNVTTFDELISTEVLNTISTNPDAALAYPGYDLFVQEQTSINEKIDAIVEFKLTNDTFVTDISTGALDISNISIVSTRSASTTSYPDLFFSTPLGTSTIASTGTTVSYVQGYTSSGTYKFKTNELVTLGTDYIALISTILANTENVELGITLGTEVVKIIQVIDSNTVLVDFEVNTSTYAPAIISAERATTFTTEDFVNVNDKIQPHTAIPFVKYANTKNPGEFIDLSVYHPVINTVFYANTYDIDMGPYTTIEAAIYDRAFMVYQIPALKTESALGFNTEAIPLNPWDQNDNVVLQVGAEEERTYTLGFNTEAIPLDSWKQNDNIVSQVGTEEERTYTLGFNIEAIPLDSWKQNDNIVSQVILEEFSGSTFSFNIEKMSGPDYLPKIGYTQPVETGTVDTLNGFTTFTLTKDDDYIPLIKEYNVNTVLEAMDTRRVVTSQTGLAVYYEAFEKLNKETAVLPKMLSATSVTVYYGSVIDDKLNKNSILVTKNITAVNTKVMDIEASVYNDKLNKNNILVTKNITSVKVKETDLTSLEFDKLNKEVNAIPAIAAQVNPDVVLATE